jgi:thiol-disulfide isomerase/thioredoxin
MKRSGVIAGVFAVVTTVLCLSVLAAERVNPESLKGEAAPDFSLKTPGGQEVALASDKGSVVVLDFWATWCGPCVASLPKIDALAKEHSDVKFYAVNIRESAEKVNKFMEAKNLSLPVLLDKDGSVAKAYLASAIPQTVVIGKDGVVQAVFIGFDPEQGEKALADAIEAAKK